MLCQQQQSSGVRAFPSAPWVTVAVCLRLCGNLPEVWPGWCLSQAPSRVGCPTPGCSDSCVSERTNPILTPFSRSSHFSGLPLPRPLSWELVSLSTWGQSSGHYVALWVLVPLERNWRQGAYVPLWEACPAFFQELHRVWVGVVG